MTAQINANLWAKYDAANKAVEDLQAKVTAAQAERSAIVVEMRDSLPAGTKSFERDGKEYLFVTKGSTTFFRGKGERKAKEPEGGGAAQKE